jgi:colicin import membrane protein
MIVSACAHAAVLLWAAVSFAAKPLDSIQIEAMPVDIISASELSQITQGSKTAPKKETPKPLVEKKAEPRPVENAQAPVSEKPEITASAPPPPAAEPPPPAPKAPEKPETKKEPEKKLTDAEALKPEKAEPKKPKKLASVAPVPPKRPVPQKKPVEKKQPRAETARLNFDQIRELIDRREPRRVAAAGETLSSVQNAGSNTGRATELSATYLNALVQRLGECWQTIGGDLREEKLKIPITLRFKPDGTLASAPQIDMPLNTHRERAMAEGVIRAVVACQPYTMLPRARYSEWQELPFNFDPNIL